VWIFNSLSNIIRKYNMKQKTMMTMSRSRLRKGSPHMQDASTTEVVTKDTNRKIQEKIICIKNILHEA
jgi:hypothetical protein